MLPMPPSGTSRLGLRHFTCRTQQTCWPMLAHDSERHHTSAVLPSHHACDTGHMCATDAASCRQHAWGHEQPMQTCNSFSSSASCCCREPPKSQLTATSQLCQRQRYTSPKPPLPSRRTGCRTTQRSTQAHISTAAAQDTAEKHVHRLQQHSSTPSGQCKLSACSSPLNGWWRRP